MSDDIYNKPDKAGRKQQIQMLKTFNQRERERLTKEVEKLRMEFLELEAEEEQLKWEK
jgi:hypothetical protein